MDLPAWTAIPFVLLLVGIAALPLAVPHWWESNRHKALVAALLSVPVVGYLLWHGAETRHALGHELADYGSFIVLLAALYVTSGGIALTGDLPARPRTNAAFLAAGAVLANLIGTTGASMLLIRPLLRTNSERRHTAHVPVFFIFVVSNTGGLLTPLGDPPLFLGFLQGVDFFWTLRLWPEWLAVNGTLILLFFVWDLLAYRREDPASVRRDETQVRPLRLDGWRLNAPLLLGVVAAVIAQKYVPRPASVAVMAALALVSVWKTPASVRKLNRFEWGPIVEVAVLFAAIFVTMTPALALLNQNGGRFGVTEPWQFFWLTGLLSSALDNAPTYLTIGAVAGGGNSLGWLSTNKPDLLAAISCGAVFMGANTYIGNGPNFMVKSIVESQGSRMPTFLGYMAYSGLILLPVFAVVTAVFFR
jgi:Na+/H+ antiporter NhaD/arsenite permease-like protein